MPLLWQTVNKKTFFSTHAPTRGAERRAMDECAALVQRAASALRDDARSREPMVQRQQTLLALYQELASGEHSAVPEIKNAQDALLLACENMEPYNAAAAGAAGAPSEAIAVHAHARDDESGEDAAGWQVLTDTGVRFADVVGARDAVRAVEEALVFPRRYAALYARMRLRPWRAILLFGPPGTGKSLLARAAAAEIDGVFLSVSCADVTSKWVGGSEKLLRRLFQDATARSPAVVFFDEIDSIATERKSETNVADQRLTNQLLLELDAVHHGDADVAVLAATNLPWALDAAVLRRFSRRVFVDLPNAAERAQLLGMLFAKNGLEFAAPDLDSFAASTHGFSGADLAVLAQDCALVPLRTLIDATHWVSDAGARVRIADPDDAEDTTYADTFENVIATAGQDAVVVPPLTVAHVLAAAARARPTLQPRDVFRYQKYLQNES